MIAGLLRCIVMSKLRDTYNPVARKLAEPPFLYMAAMGRVPGYSTEFLIGNHFSASSGVDELIWTHDGLLTQIPTPQPIYVSSTSALDNTGAVIFLRCLDTNYDRVSLIGVLDGQNQVACVGLTSGEVENVVWVQSGIVQFPGSKVGAIGDVYIATQSGVSLGVPTEPETIQNKIVATHNITRSAYFMVPRGRAAITTGIRGNTDNLNKVATVITKITYDNAPPVRSVDYYLNPELSEFSFPLPVATVDISGETSVVLPEKTKVEFLVNADQVNTNSFFGVDLLLGEISQFGEGSGPTIIPTGRF